MNSPVFLAVFLALAGLAAADNEPLKAGAVLTLNGHTASLTKLEALPFVENEYSKRFKYDAATNPKLTELRDRYPLDEVVAPGKDEFERQVLLNDWTHRKY